MSLFAKTGRVHRASVKAVDTIKSSVTVDWQEREQTLSKEVSAGGIIV